MISEPPKLPEIKEGMKSIKDYKLATKDIEGVIDLSITYCEQAIEYSDNYLYNEEDLEDSIDNVIQEVKQIIEEDKSKTFIKLFKDDLLKLYRLADKAENYVFEECIGYPLEELGIKESD